MLSKLKNFALYILSFVFLLFPMALRAQFGLQETAREAGLAPASGDAIGPARLIGAIVGYALAMVGVIFFVLMVYGGFLWMTARGKEEQIKKAKDLIESAMIGIVIVFISYVVTRFVVSSLTGAAIPSATPPAAPAGGGVVTL